MKLLRHLPNALTLCNLLFGMLGIIALINDEITTTMLLMLGSLIADALDGALARKLSVDGDLGIQLDSLADMVTFGVLPGLMLYYAGFNYGNNSFDPFLIGLLASLSVVSAGLRLGRFNVDERAREYFWGLATPAGGLMVASWVWAQHKGMELGLGLSSHPWLIIGIPVFLIIFYQVSLKLPGLKSNKRGRITLGVLTLGIIAGTAFYGTIAIFLGIVTYIALGMVNLIVKWY